MLSASSNTTVISKLKVCQPTGGVISTSHLTWAKDRQASLGKTCDQGIESSSRCLPCKPLYRYKSAYTQIPHDALSSPIPQISRKFLPDHLFNIVKILAYYLLEFDGAFRYKSF